MSDRTRAAKTKDNRGRGEGRRRPLRCLSVRGALRCDLRRGHVGPHCHEAGDSFSSWLNK